MRMTTSLLILVATISYAHAGDRYVDLNKPGAMDQLKRDNPAHYQTVSAILEDVLKEPDKIGPDWIRVTYKAEDVVYYPILLASNPPKRELSFRLDEVQYRKLLTLPYAQPVPQPAISSGQKRSR